MAKYCAGEWRRSKLGEWRSTSGYAESEDDESEDCINVDSVSDDGGEAQGRQLGLLLLSVAKKTRAHCVSHTHKRKTSKQILLLIYIYLSLLTGYLPRGEPYYNPHAMVVLLLGTQSQRPFPTRVPGV